MWYRRCLLGRPAIASPFLALQRMTKGNTKFTSRLRVALTRLTEDKRSGLMPTQSGSLFSPMLRRGAYEWTKLMDSDGLLVSRRPIRAASGRPPKNQVHLLIGVILQSEDSTSMNKPSPFGKAAIGHVRNGVWVDLAGLGRRRPDRVYVLLLLPSGSAPKHRRSLLTRQRNVETAAALMPDCDTLTLDRGLSAKGIASELTEQTRGWLRGRGRPRT